MPQIPQLKSQIHKKKTQDLTKHENKKQLLTDQHEKIRNYNNINNLIDKYIFYLQYEKNVSPKTIENYSLWLNRFSNYI